MPCVSYSVRRASLLLGLLSVLGSLTPARTACANPVVVFTQDFSNTPSGPWFPPPKYPTRGPLWIEYPTQSDGTKGPVLSTLGLLQGERVVFPVSIDGAQASLRYDVDFQRIVPLIDTALMWHVNVNPTTHVQRYYQAALLHGAQPDTSSSWRIQLIEENPALARGFTATTLANVVGPTVTPEGWHHLQVRVEGPDRDVFVVSLDGADVVSAQDSTLRSGQVGLRVGLDLTRWDNVSVAYEP